MRIIILITAFLLSSLALSQQGEPGAENNQGENDSPNEITIRGEFFAAIEDSINRIAANTTLDQAAQQRQDRSDRINTGLARLDLGAQESMAESTYFIMWFSAFAVLLTAFGLWMLYRTMFFTKGALDEARKSTAAATRAAEAASDANRIMHESSKAQLRPYLSIKINSLTTGDSVHKGTGEKVSRYVRVDFEIKNSGITPANNVFWGCVPVTGKGMSLASYTIPSSIFHGKPKPINFSGVIPSEGSVNGNVVIFDDPNDPVGDAESADAAIAICWFVVQFNDVFQRTIKTYMCGYFQIGNLFNPDKKMEGVNVGFKVSGGYPLNGEEIEEEPQDPTRHPRKRNFRKTA